MHPATHAWYHQIIFFIKTLPFARSILHVAHTHQPPAHTMTCDIIDLNSPYGTSRWGGVSEIKIMQQELWSHDEDWEINQRVDTCLLYSLPCTRHSYSRYSRQYLTFWGEKYQSVLVLVPMKLKKLLKTTRNCLQPVFSSSSPGFSIIQNLQYWNCTELSNTKPVHLRYKWMITLL
jgi:hypothetical protein